ncbi:MAG TPA: group II intron reverse transcriptase/maturase [Elusimicrobia bacterium]|nr:group II intron reverse transcriptase/maturase [Elusimicrobiota bacterium]
MSLEDAGRHKSIQMELPLLYSGETAGRRRSAEALTAVYDEGSSSGHRLMEWVVAEGNMVAALKRVRRNKGSPGIDGMSVEELPEYLAWAWDGIRRKLLAGTYQPEPVKRVEIPKPNGGVRQLGIPTAVDRMIQQMVLNVLQPGFDRKFSEHSYGFRPGRSAQQAVKAARRYIQDGRKWVVDVDLEKFFDRVNHDILMSRLATRIKDKRVLGLIRRYLEAGVMAQGVVVERWEGTPQGGPLSPLLANVLLDEVDKELEKRGHAFVRYADDGNVYVRSEAAALGVMETLKRIYAKLRLKINGAKSGVRRARDSQYLGYGFWVAKGGIVRHSVSRKALKVMKERVRRITSRNGGRSLEEMAKELKAYLTGWKEYFRLAETHGIFAGLDSWIRRRLRMVRLKQWKRGRTIYRELRAAGVSVKAAASVSACPRRWWRMAGTSALNVAMPNSYFSKLGVPRLAEVNATF